MKRGLTGIAILSLVAGLTPIGAHGAAPGLLVTKTGAPAKWDNSQPITYDIDQGKLGTLTNTKAADLVAKAFDQWAGVDTAKLSFQEGDPLDVDVTGASLGNFLNGLNVDKNPIIFDSDGGVMDGLLGAGASLNLAAFGQVLLATKTGTIMQGMVIINGRAVDGAFDPDDVTSDDLTRVIVQSIGQMLNLGFSDVNDELIFDGKVADHAAVPVMHPGVAVNGVTVPIIGGGFTLTEDDRIAASMLYPAADIDTKLGTIQGKVLLADGTTGLQGIDVIARKVDDPVNTAISAISGSGFVNSGPRSLNPLLNGLPEATGSQLQYSVIANMSGSRDPSLQGAYSMRVPPGNYTLEFRPLRHNIGPLLTVFPLPGGPQFYGATSSPTAAPPTPIAVTAGKVTEANFTVPGKAAPAPQAVDGTGGAHDRMDTAVLLPLSATVTGHVAPSAPGASGQVILNLGGGTFDKVEDIYRLAVPETSILNVRLDRKTATAAADLYLFSGNVGTVTIIARSESSEPSPKAVQIVVGPGVYYIGVSAQDFAQTPTPTDYTLTVTTTAAPDQPLLPRPVLNQFVLGDVTDTGATASWVTDVDAVANVVVGLPLQQFGDLTAGKTHKVAVTGLTGGSYADITAISQAANEQHDQIPRVYFRTADKTPATGDPKIQAAVISQVQDFITAGDTDQSTMLIEIAIQNTGGPATNAQITGLTVSPGWKLAQPITPPLTIGGIGSGATAIVVVRLVRDGTGTPPLASVTGTGTLAGASGAAVNFTFGP